MVNKVYVNYRLVRGGNKNRAYSMGRVFTDRSSSLTDLQLVRGIRFFL